MTFELMAILMIICFAALPIMAYAYFKDREILRVQWNSVSTFCGFMAFVTVIRFCIFDYGIRNLGMQYPLLPDHMYQNGLWSLGTVFWEDAFFGMSIYYAWKKLKQFPAIIFTLGMSALFGMGHGYQGEWFIYVSALYPYFISYKYGVKCGFGTVMICHILYDMITVLTVQAIPYLLP